MDVSFDNAKNLQFFITGNLFSLDKSILTGDPNPNDSSLGTLNKGSYLCLKKLF